MNAKPKKSKFATDKNTVEALKMSASYIGTGVADEFKDFSKESMKDMWAQFFGANEKGASQDIKRGDIQEGEEFSLTNSATTTEHKKRNIEPGIRYFDEVINGEKRITNEQENALGYQIQEILVEIKEIANASSELQVQFKEVTTDQRITKPGKYHVGLFSFVLKLLRDARKKVESSSNFLAALHNKKRQRGYWNMFKKHGTSFGLSNERVVATQTG